MPPKKPFPTEQGKKSNKFRLVVFEGDFSDGSVAEIAQALTSAIKPTGAPVMRQLTSGKPGTEVNTPEPETEPQAEEAEEAVELGENQSAEEPNQAAASESKGAKSRKFRQPELVDIDWTGTGGPTFKEFAQQKAPKSRARRYLVAALWLKEYGGHPTVNADKVYSAFRAAGWSVAFGDWTQPFRSLAFTDHMRKGANSGEYSITTVGQGMVEKAEE